LIKIYDIYRKELIMEKFIKWHKLHIGRWQNRLRIDNYQTLWLSWLKGIIVGVIIMSLFSGCMGTYYISDAEYSDLREEHAAITYYNNQIYWGWYSGYYYYYGTPHYYPWYYYYNACPPSHYATTTHVIISRPVNRPTHRPNRPKVNTHRPNIRTNSNKKIVITPNRNTKVKTNTRVKTNRNNSNRSNKTNNRRPR
jgi:hypothetical protein|tara:strand:+ start:113 stop:700 length:588 start_codon:yes stop_codon:yes gene_type:complete